MEVNIGIDDTTRKELPGQLGHLLADTYTLYLKTQNYHWNVTGPMFRACTSCSKSSTSSYAMPLT